MTEKAGGLQVIREAVAARASAHVIMARDCGVSLDLIDSFAKGNADIPAENRDLIVAWVWSNNIRYNSEADALEPVPQPEARSLGIPPTFQHQVFINGETLPKFTLCPPPRGPQPVEPPPKPKPRRGFIGGIWE